MANHTFIFGLTKKTKNFYRYDQCGEDGQPLDKDHANCNFGKFYIPNDLFSGAHTIFVTVEEVEQGDAQG